MDHEIGRFVDAIGEAGIAENTLILFSSDNGGSIPHGALNGKLRGGKQEHWEGGIRVPTCAVWPGNITPGQTDALGITMDLLPTFCKIAGVKINHEIDGHDLSSVLLDGHNGKPDRTLIWVRREGGGNYQGRAYYAIRRGPWKLLQNSPFEPMQLFNIDQDLQEKSPISSNKKTAQNLKRSLMDHIQRSGKIPWQKQSK